jgi:hypothetical protein
MTTRGKTAACPQIVLDWIAWYPEGDLPSELRGAIEAHAAECSACHEEIALVAGDAEVPAGELPDASRVLSRVLAKIEVAPRPAAPARERRVWRVRPPAAIAAGLLLAALSSAASIVATQGLGLGGDVFETAASGARGASRSGAHLDVVFRPEAPFASVQEALTAIGASVEAGPTAGGVVHIRLAEGADVDAAAAQLESGESPIALYAQPAP